LIPIGNFFKSTGDEREKTSAHIFAIFASLELCSNRESWFTGRRLIETRRGMSH
jgi:hypothetical protein